MSKLKNFKDITACIVDYGNFIDLADKLAESYNKVYYYAPFETEYLDSSKYVIGQGVPYVERLYDLFNTDIFNSIDLFIFPDIGFVGLQKYLISVGKAVWGSREVTNIELYRSKFLDVIEELGLPVPESEIVVGVKALNKVLKETEDVWVKVDLFREDMETWHHIDYVHSLPMLRYLADEFGGVSEQITFIIQETIPDAQELGYDGFCIDGEYPELSFQGYEKKNELYLGSCLSYNEMPENVIIVNEAMSPYFKEHQYRNFFASEIRDEFFIDPTPRMAGQTQEHLLETCSNLAEVIWMGANGVMVQPKYIANIAASATLHYKEVPGEHWKSVRIPKEVEKYFKLANYIRVGDIYNFPPGRTNEIGVVVGWGDNIEDAINMVKENLEAVKDEPIDADIKGFVDILYDIEKAQEEGNKFTDEPLPDPSFVVD